MKKSLAHLPKHKRDELKLIVKKIRERIEPEMIILYGSYARGDYKEQKDSPLIASPAMCPITTYSLQPAKRKPPAIPACGTMLQKNAINLN